MRRLLVLPLVVLVLCGAARAASVYSVQADTSVGGLAVGRATLPQAIARFGVPTTRKAAGETCTAAWKRLGLTISFLVFGGNACRSGGGVVFTIRDRAHWRTGKGLRVGDATPRVHALYPQATLHPGDGYWIVPRRSCKETGAQPYPGLLARVRYGQVTALVVTAGVCE
jgi:hypothetical protein